VEPLGPQHDRDTFTCGKEPLDRYLRQQARQDASRYAAAPFVAISANDMASQQRINGYYTLAALGIDPGELPRAEAKKLPRYPLLPATLLGRLAVDRMQRGKGLGEFLLMDALHRAYRQAGQIGAIAVVVDALDDDARQFYLHFGFLALLERTDRLYLPRRSIASLFP
jgi:predicted GNAT family N-acyltransferase